MRLEGFVQMKNSMTTGIEPATFQPTTLQQHISLVTVVSAISSPPFQTLRHQRKVRHLVVIDFTQ
jgi:hypothetical protein